MFAGQNEDRVCAVLAERIAERIDPAARGRMEVRKYGGVPVIEADLLGPFRVFFTTRHGGDSVGPYASLNLDPGSKDDPLAVANNRSRVVTALGGGVSGPGSVEPETAAAYRLVSPVQVHGLRVIGAAEYVGETKGAQELGRPGSPCDGLTLHPLLDRGLAAVLLHADCLPVVLVGEADMAVVHGGWRGILGGIVEQGGRSMISSPSMAVIGPSIGPCCFEVDDQVAGAFAQRFGPDVVSYEPAGGQGRGRLKGDAEGLAAGCAASYARDACRPQHGHARVNLWAAATIALAELGIKRDRVVNPRICTVCNRDLFFSYRADGPVTGRQGCVAWTVAA